MLYDASKPRKSLDNYLLSILPPDEFNFIRPHLEPLAFPRGKIIADLGDPIRYCFFPNDGMISLLSVTEAGDTCEVGYIGYEGVVGLPVIFGKNEMPYQALVQADSQGFRAPIQVVADLFNRGGKFHDSSLRFAFVLMRQFAQTSACNRFHSIEARLCRWFAVMSERSGERHLALTQEFLAYMLGVQRTSVGTIATQLQSDGIIKYSRGRIRIVDIERLKTHACECFELIDCEYADFLDQKNLTMSSTRQTRVSKK